MKWCILRNVAAVAVCLALFGPAAHAQSPTPVASVNGEIITAENIDVLGSAYFANLRKQYGDHYTQEVDSHARREVLNNIIDATLLKQEAARRGIVAPEARVDSVVASNDYFKNADGSTDWDKFARYKADPASNYKQIAANLRRLVTADMLTLSRRDELGRQVSDDSLRTLYTRYMTVRAGQLMVIRPDTIVQVEKGITEDDITRRYMRRREALRSAEVHLTAFRVRRSDFTVPLSEVDEKDIVAYYGQHLEDFIDSTRASKPLDEVHEQVRARVAFARADEAARAEAQRVAARLMASGGTDKRGTDHVTVDSAVVYIGLAHGNPLYPDSLGRLAVQAGVGHLLGPISFGSSVAVYQVTAIVPGAVPPLAVARDTLVAELQREAETAKERKLEDYYRQHIASYMSTDRFVLDYLVVRRLPKDPPVSVAPAAIRQYYLSHKDRFTTPEEVRAAHVLIPSGVGSSRDQDSLAYVRADSIYQAAIGGADFGELARLYSADPGSAANGGDLGTFGRGRMLESFEEAAFALRQPGQISRPVRTPYGFHVIKLLGRRDARTAPIEDVAGIITGELTKAAEQDSLRATGEKMIRRLLAGRSFDVVAAPYGGVRRTDPFPIGDPLPVLGKQPEIDRVLRTLRPGDYCPSPIAVSSGYVVFRVVDKLPPAPIPLDKIHDQVDRTMFREQQQGLALNRAQSIRDQVRAGGNFFTLASGYGELKRIGPWKRGEDSQGLGLLTPAQEDTLDAVPLGGAECLSLTYGVAAVNITALTPPDPAAYEKDKSNFRTRIGGELYGAWMADLKKKATIKYFGKQPE